MCCLFGMIDYRHNFTGEQKNRMLSVLAAECEARGTDATGIAYNAHGNLHIYKRPVPAHMMKIQIPNGVHAVMGHTRMATQGSQSKNYNNHPFKGTVSNREFALAHNGVLYDDIRLRNKLHLPKTRIETDSYMAVQLIEQKKALDFSSLKYMAEKVEGSFTFTILDNRNSLYIVKGDNPLCLLHYPKTGLYLYASTDAILYMALRKMGLPAEEPIELEVECGEILRIGTHGEVIRGTFSTDQFYPEWCCHPWTLVRRGKTSPQTQDAEEREYVENLKYLAGFYGYRSEVIDRMLISGFSPEEIETFLYCGEV